MVTQSDDVVPLLERGGMQRAAPPPFVLGIILGPLAEENLKRALVMADGSWDIFVTRPICVAFLLITVFFTAYSIRKNRQAAKALSEAAKASGNEDGDKGDD